MSQSSYTAWPPLYGITIVSELTENDEYVIPRSQTLVFPFGLRGYDAVQITAGQTDRIGNQNSTIQGWPSAEINGISLAMSSHPALARKNISHRGYDWRLIDGSVDPSRLVVDADLNEPDLTLQISGDRGYYMCLKNLENKDNGLYLRFRYLRAR